MSFDHVLVRQEGPVTVITINRPNVLNALHGLSHRELSDIFDDFAADPGQQVAILTGSGERAFCAGNDLKAQQNTEWSTKDFMAGTGFGGLTFRFNLNKPIIAAVNGVAMGGGFELALACDMIIAAEHATFALPEPRVGLIAAAGGPARLARAIGDKRAMEIALTCRHVSAEEGKALGFISNITASGEVLATALQTAQAICKASPKAIRATKENLKLGQDMELETALRNLWTFPAMKTLFASNDIYEGPRAFTEKRPALWEYD